MKQLLRVHVLLFECQTSHKLLLRPALPADVRVQVRFSIPYRCQFGQHVRIVGSAQSLGAWNLENAMPMVWSEGDIWTAEVQFPVKYANCLHLCTLCLGKHACWPAVNT